MDHRTETVVFIVEDPAAAKPFWDAFKNRTAIYGMRPIAVGAGDQMTVPSEIAEAVRHMDEENLSRAEMRSLIRQAKEWDAEQMKALGLPAST